MKAKILGVQKVGFTNNNGEVISGTNIFVAFPDENVEGVRTEKFWLKDGINLPRDTAYDIKDRVILSGIHEYYEPEELVGKTAIVIVNLPLRKMMGIDSEGMLISAVHEEDGHEGLNLLMVNDRIPAGAKLY